MGFLDSFGSIICHQIPERSLFFAGSQIFVCARDVGIYLGVLAGFILLYLLKELDGNDLDVKYVIMLIIPVVFDGTTQLLGWESSNILRLFSGGMFGVAMACLLVSSYNMMQDKEKKVIPSINTVIGGIVVGMLMVLIKYLPQSLYSFWLVGIGTFISIVLIIAGLGALGILMYKRYK
ncbi:DUF2085 domain-containing protein [Candidatus Undinarchaeota archaeon]